MCKALKLKKRPNSCLDTRNIVVAHDVLRNILASTYSIFDVFYSKYVYFSHTSNNFVRWIEIQNTKDSLTLFYDPGL